MRQATLEVKLALFIMRSNPNTQLLHLSTGKILSIKSLKIKIFSFLTLSIFIARISSYLDWIRSVIKDDLCLFELNDDFPFNLATHSDYTAGST